VQHDVLCGHALACRSRIFVGFRTNAGVDHIGTFRKMSVYEQRDDRVMVLMTAGNLSISQSVRELLNTYTDAGVCRSGMRRICMKRRASSAKPCGW
jgi:predicted proteasome-type protease